VERLARDLGALEEDADAHDEEGLGALLLIALFP
jgi:hypothetical protein